MARINIKAKAQAKGGMSVLVAFEGIDQAIGRSTPGTDVAVHWTRSAILPGTSAFGAAYPAAGCSHDRCPHAHGTYHAIVRHRGLGFQVTLSLELVDKGIAIEGPRETFVSEPFAHAWAISMLGDQLGTGNIAFGSIVGQEDQHWMNRRLPNIADRSHRAI